MKEHEIVSAVQRSTGVPDGQAAKRVVQATLRTLGSRLQAGESRDLASQLPPALATVLPDQGSGERFGVEEFYQRVADSEGCDRATARQHARAVAAVLKNAITAGELNDVLSQLPADYEDLFATSGPVY